MKIILLGNPMSTNHAYRHTCIGGHARSYMKKEAVSLKESYQWQAKIQWRWDMISGPVEVMIRVYLPTKRITDWDNLHKLSMDACNGIVWKDDSQVWKSTVERLYDKTNPRIELSVTESLT